MAIDRTHVKITPTNRTAMLTIQRTKARGNVYLMTMTAPFMGQSTSGANVTKINMVTIFGPADPPMATPAILRQPQANTPGEDTRLLLHLKFISPSDRTKTHPVRCLRKGPKAIMDTTTPLVTVINPIAIIKTTTIITIMSVIIMMNKIMIKTMTTYRKVPCQSRNSTTNLLRCLASACSIQAVPARSSTSVQFLPRSFQKLVLAKK